MTVADAQREVRAVFVNGSVGQLVSGAIWLVSVALSTWAGTRQAIIALVVGGMFIFPIMQLLLRLSGRPFTLDPQNPLRYLALQIALIIPLTLPVAGAAAIHNVNWFYPGCMVVVGAHYLPFVFLYGRWHFALLAAILITGGLALGVFVPNEFSPGGWLTGLVLVLFGVWLALSREAAPAP